MVREFILIASMLGLCATGAHADTDLTGLNEFSIAVSNLDEDAQKCGLNEPLLKTAFMYPASAARFKVVEFAFAKPSMDISLITGLSNNDSQCTTSIVMSLSVYSSVKLDYGRFPVGVQILLWRSFQLMWSGRAAHPKQVTEFVERSTKVFITKWNLENK